MFVILRIIWNNFLAQTFSYCFKKISTLFELLQKANRMCSLDIKKKKCCPESLESFTMLEGDE